MYVMQLIHLKNIDDKVEVTNEPSIQVSSKENSPEEKIAEKNLNNEKTSQIKNQLKNTNQIKTSPIKNLINQKEKSKIEITSFQDLVDQANNEKEIELKYDLERNVKLVSFNKGKIDISFNEKLNKNFIKNLTEKLLLWTGNRWIISLSKNKEAKSIYEKDIENKNNQFIEFKKSKFADEIETAFPDAELIDVKNEKE